MLEALLTRAYPFEAVATVAITCLVGGILATWAILRREEP